MSLLPPSGGIRPGDRKRSRWALSLIEREEISRGLVGGRSLRAIAAQLGRAPSTISREVGRNGGADCYRATVSDQSAWERALRPKRCKLACHPNLRRTVSRKLRRKCSPEQIAGWLKHSFRDEEQHRVSHETIYKSLYIQTRGVLKRAARASAGQAHDPPLAPCQPEARRAWSAEERDIDQRAAGVDRGSRRPGTLGGRPHCRIAQQLYCDAGRAPVALRDAGQGRQQGYRQCRLGADQTGPQTPRELYQSLTWDRGKELADHQRFTLATDVDVYFCDPRSPWQRGTNENTNRLLRQYLPRAPIYPSSARPS